MHFHFCFSYRDDDNKENYLDNTAVLGERQLPLQDNQQHKEQTVTDYALKPDMGNLKLRKPKPLAKLENGKSHEESQVKTEFTKSGFMAQCLSKHTFWNKKWGSLVIHDVAITPQ